jgi:DNA end-binding protein Ku
VALSDIDPVFFEKSYHLAPQRGGERPYLLLLRAMERAGRIGIGRFVLRTKPHLVAIRPEEGLIGLETMFFGDEVRDGRELAWGIEGLEVSERELGMAEMLIETLKTEWNPAAYSDTYR